MKTLIVALTVLVGSGCSASHLAHERDGSATPPGHETGGSTPLDLHDGGPAAMSVLEAPLATECLPPSSATIELPPDAGCVATEIALTGSDGCTRAPTPGPAPPVGTGLRFIRHAPGAVYVRFSGCDVVAYPFFADACPHCSDYTLQPRGEVMRFSDNGIREVLVSVREGHACDRVQVEACFDPDYGPSPFPDY